MRASLLPSALALALASQTLPPAPAPRPGDSASPVGERAEPAAVPYERLRYNAGERTREGLERLETGDAAGAAASFGTAGRLAADDPLARFNAGTADLLAGIDGALDHLELAAETAPAELAPAARFNLGNARLAAGDAAGAIEAFKQSLRLAPGNRDVKHNLELALQQQQQQQQEQEQQQQEQQQNPSDDSQPENQDQPDENQDGENEREEQQPGEEPNEPQDQDSQGEGELPDFEDQPDMSAEQAAAILEAVENLERDERRRQAAEQARKRGKKGKDW